MWIYLYLIIVFMSLGYSSVLYLRDRPHILSHCRTWYTRAIMALLMLIFLTVVACFTPLLTLLFLGRALFRIFV